MRLNEVTTIGDLDLLTVVVSREDVDDIAGALAQLSIAVNESHTVELDSDRLARLERARELVAKWSGVLRRKADLARDEAQLRARR